MVFASVLEPHGYFNEARETSISVHPDLKEITVLGHSNKATILEIKGLNDLSWTIMISNQKADAEQEHRVEFSGVEYTWKGNYKVSLN